MAEIVVVGAGLIGLSTALLLARDGHRVTVLEKDPSPPPRPASAWDDWERPGVNQFRLVHLMLPRWTAEMQREVPAVIDRMAAAGAPRFNVLQALPTSWSGGPRSGDDRFDTVTARRPVIEAVLAQVAAQTPGLTVLRGATVTGLIAGQQRFAGVPRVAGVLTRDRSLRADLVVDAGGHRSAMPALIEGIGARRPAETRDESGFVYYVRHFRSTDPAVSRPAVTATLLSHYDSVSLLTLPCDNGTWGAGFAVSSRDKQAKVLRDVDSWQRAFDLFPDQQPWSRGLPIGPVQVIAGIEDRARNYLPGGDPVVTGLVAVGDAWACTNPSLGRGGTIGLIHARVLRDVLRSVDAGDPEELVQAFQEATQREVAPLFDASVTFTRHRLAEIDADIAGVPYVTDDPGWGMSNALYAAAHRDPDVLRAYLDVAAALALPEQALSTPGLGEKVMTLGANMPRYFQPGPSRAEFLAALRQPVLLSSDPTNEGPPIDTGASIQTTSRRRSRAGSAHS